MSKPSDILTVLECVLKPRVEEAGGTVEVVSSLDHALEKLAKKPSSFRVILNWDGYGSHPHSNTGMANARFTTYLQANLGLAKNRGAKMYQTSIQGEPSFLERLEQLSQWVRSIRFQNGWGVDCDGFVLEDSDWVSGNPTDTTAHLLTWTLQMALPRFGKHTIIQQPHS